MLADHYSSNRDLLSGRKPTMLANSFLVDLHKAETPTVAWIAFGTPKLAIYFPICLAGDLPAEYSEGTPSATIQQRIHDLAKLPDRGKLAQAIERLQTKFDLDTEEFQTRALDYLQHGKPYLVAQLRRRR